MQSEVSICNRALFHMGTTRRIAALLDVSEEAQACRLFYEPARDALLSGHPWLFATASAQLPLKVESSAYGRYVYGYPTNCLSIRRVYTGGDTTSHDAYKIRRGGDGGKVVVCDVPGAWADFTYKVTDPSEFPPLFAEALAWRLAVDLCLPLKGDSASLRGDIMQYYLAARSRAIVADANEQHNEERTDYYRRYVAARS